MTKRLFFFLSVISAAPDLVFAAAPTTFKGLANQIATILGSVTTDLIVFAIVLYFYGITSSLFKSEKGREELKQRLFWGLAVIFLAVSIWGIVSLFQSTIFGAGSQPTNGIGGGGGGATTNCSGFTNCSFGQLQ